jgi:hypothetical protein
MNNRIYTVEIVGEGVTLTESQWGLSETDALMVCLKRLAADRQLPAGEITVSVRLAPPELVGSDSPM